MGTHAGDIGGRAVLGRRPVFAGGVAMPQPTYLANDVWKRAQDLSFKARVEEDIHKLTFPSIVQDGIDQITKLGQSIMPQPPQPLDVEPLQAPEPLPIVISDRPEMPDQQAQQPRAVTTSAAPEVAAPQQGLQTSGGGRAAQYAALIDQVAREEGVPPDVLAALLDTEGSGEDSVSPAGARGLMQVVPGQGYDLPGEDARDPLTSFRQGARAIKDKYRVTGDWDEAGAAYFGYGTDAGGMTTDVYRERYRQNRQRYQQPQGMAPSPSVSAAPEAPQQPVTAPRGPAAQQAGAPQGVADGPGWRQTWGNDLTPHQINETLALGLSWDAAIATCGVAAAIAFARANGRNPTFKEALELAQSTGEWNQDVGMTRGSMGQVALLQRLGVDAHVRPVNEQEIARAIQAGQPVQINAHGGGGHFYVISAMRDGPSGREYYFGNSASILKRSNGRQWYRLDELASLGVGTPSEAIYLGRAPQ